MRPTITGRSRSFSSALLQADCTTISRPASTAMGVKNHATNAASAHLGVLRDLAFEVAVLMVVDKRT